MLRLRCELGTVDLLTAMTEEQAGLAASVLDGMFDEVHAFAVDPGHILMLGFDEVSARCVRDALRGRSIDPDVAVWRCPRFVDTGYAAF